MHASVFFLTAMSVTRYRAVAAACVLGALAGCGTVAVRHGGVVAHVFSTVRRVSGEQLCLLGFPAGPVGLALYQLQKLLMMMASPLRSEVVRLYKNLLHLGREYPKGGDYFRERLRAAFRKNKAERDPERIKEMIARGEYVSRELEALYYLRKYRAMKKRYYEE